MKSSNYSKLILAACLIPALVLCSHAQKAAENKPSLLDDPLVRYPHELYISAVSSGDTPEAAKNRAIGDVAKVIECDIKLQQQLLEQYLESGSDMSLEYKSQFIRQIDITTDLSLQNVNIGKTWFDDKDGRYYAVAYMDRMETAEIYQQEIGRLDEQVKDYYDKAQTATAKLNGLAYITKAISLAFERDILMNQLNVITLGEESYTPQVKPTELSDARHRITQTIKVKLDLHYGPYSELPGAVSEVMQSYGLGLSDTEPDIIITGDLRIEQLEREGYFVRWIVELHFTDTATNTEFITYNEDDREGSTSFGEAERRAIMRMTGEVKKSLYQRLDDYFNGLL